MSRATPNDWLDAGLVLLRDRGHEALTIDALCRQLGRTKGSFYHHFADVSVFSRRLLEHWEQRSTEDRIASAGTSGSASERRAHLYASVRTVAYGVERAIQAWALHSPDAREVRSRVDARRIAYLAELRRADGVKPKLAERLGQIEYAAFLGALQIFELPDPAGWKAFEKANALLLRALEAIAAQSDAAVDPSSSARDSLLRRNERRLR